MTPMIFCVFHLQMKEKCDNQSALIHSENEEKVWLGPWSFARYKRKDHSFKEEQSRQFCTYCRAQLLHVDTRSWIWYSCFICTVRRYWKNMWYILNGKNICPSLNSWDCEYQMLTSSKLLVGKGENNKSSSALQQLLFTLAWVKYERWEPGEKVQ